MQAVALLGSSTFALETPWRFKSSKDVFADAKCLVSNSSSPVSLCSFNIKWCQLSRGDCTAGGEILNSAVVCGNLSAAIPGAKQKDVVEMIADTEALTSEQEDVQLDLEEDRSISN